MLLLYQYHQPWSTYQGLCQYFHQHQASCGQYPHMLFSNSLKPPNAMSLGWIIMSKINLSVVRSQYPLYIHWLSYVHTPPASTTALYYVGKTEYNSLWMRWIHVWIFFTVCSRVWRMIIGVPKLYLFRFGTILLWSSIMLYMNTEKWYCGLTSPWGHVIVGYRGS